MAEHALAGTFPPFFVSNAYAGTIVYPPGGRFHSRIQPDYQLVLVHTGCVDVTIDDIWHHIQPGNVALLTPGHTEDFTFAKEQQTWHRWISIHVDSSALQSLNLSEPKPPLSIPISDELNKITDLMLSLLKNGHSPESAAVKMLGLSSLELFLFERIRLDSMRSIHPSVLFIKQLIHNEYAQDLTLQRLSALSNLSQQHLNRLFQRYENQTPIQYLWRYRVEQGIEYLHKTGLTISEIAHQTGFKTSYHFARLIKQHTGRTPSELRNGNYNL